MNDVNFERNIERYEIQSQNNTNSNDQMAYSHQSRILLFHSFPIFVKSEAITMKGTQ